MLNFKRFLSPLCSVRNDIELGDIFIDNFMFVCHFSLIN